jgi:hypothetical protein
MGERHDRDLSTRRDPESEREICRVEIPHIPAEKD